MKKSILTLVVTLSVALVGSVSAQDETPGSDSKKNKGKGGKKPDLAKVFAKLDKDSDKKVTLEEFSAQKRWEKAGKEKAAKAFARIDKNDDKSITLEEMKASRKKAGARAGKKKEGGKKKKKADA